MKINNNKDNNRIHFSAGLTRSLTAEISSCNPQKIESLLLQRNIKSNFDSNKVVAWSAQQCISIIDKLNSNFNLNLCLPKAIYLEDFNKLNIANKETASGFCNFSKQNLYEENNNSTDGLSIFFNKNIPWKYIDEISDYQYAQRDAPTDLFLDVIFHEFMHIIHGGNMLNKLGENKMQSFLTKALAPNNVIKFQTKHINELKKICDYAIINPIETVACDLNKIISSNVDRNSLMININPFINTPYTNIPFLQKVKICLSSKSNNEDKLDKILRNFWNGKFE